jgi:glycosyltransferase involved in cell wall biosynthesis
MNAPLPSWSHAASNCRQSRAALLAVTQIDQEPLKIPWVSLAVLKLPRIRNSVVEHGALILNQVDPVLDIFPGLESLFIIIERQGWFGYTRSFGAAIKLVEDEELLANTHRIFPDAILLNMGPADFVDHHSFRPVAEAETFDGIAIACWSPRKRIELLVQAAALLPQRRFVHLGHFENAGSRDEIDYRDHCVRLAASVAPNLYFPFLSKCRNEEMPVDKASINQWINRAKIGILTTTNEGINRFKMECIAANRPVLVPADVEGPTRKHVTPQTGLFYEPTPESLAAAFERAFAAREQFRPRQYLLATSGKDISVNKLRRALRDYCERSKIPYRFDDIEWDGRNESLTWGQPSIEALKSIMAKFRTNVPPSHDRTLA